MNTVQALAPTFRLRLGATLAVPHDLGLMWIASSYSFYFTINDTMSVSCKVDWLSALPGSELT